MMTARGWSARLAAAPAMLWGAGREPPDIQPWSDDAFESLQRDALVATIGVPVRAGDEFGWLAMPRIAPIPKGMDDVLGRRAALVVCESRAAPSTAIIAVAKGDLPEAEQATRTTGALCVTLAVEAPELARVIERGDAAGADLWMRLRGDKSCDGSAQAASALLPDEQVRELPVQCDGAGLTQFGPDPALSWGYARSTDRPRAGWWVLSLAPAGSGSVELVRRMLAAEAPGADGRRRVSIGVVRPARLLAFAGESDVLRPMRWVDTLRWDCWLTPAGSVEGELEVRMAIDPGHR